MQDPAVNFVAVTPHDSTNLAQEARALFVGGAGNVACINKAGTAVTFVGVTAGSILPVRTLRINSTNTTATYIVALF
jgi:hypothetical protein